MVNIIRSLILSLIGLGTLAWLSIVLISIMLVGPDPDGALDRILCRIYNCVHEN